MAALKTLMGSSKNVKQRADMITSAVTTFISLFRFFSSVFTNNQVVIIVMTVQRKCSLAPVKLALCFRFDLLMY